MNPLIILAGPTAVGKTELSLKLAQRINGEIISADSMQVYRRMNIGTAKPSREEQEKVPHHLIDLVEPDQDFSVADYKRYFEPTVASIYAKGKLPLVTGGTGLYIRACIQAFNLEPGAPLLDLRQELKEQAERFGPDYIHQKLAKVDPQAAAKIHPNDLRRVIRAIEVYHSTGLPISELQQKRSARFKYNVIYLFLNRERQELYRRIEHRVEQMIGAGFIEEVRSLLESGLSSNLKSMQSLGYKQLCRYLQGTISLDEAVAAIKQETRHYAKRQLTWFKREPIDYTVNIFGGLQEYFGDILNYIEGRLGVNVE